MSSGGLWGKLASRLACRIYVCGIAILVISSVAFRLQASLFASHTLAMVHALSNLRVGVTSKTEVLTQLPSLKATQPDPSGGSHCDADEGLSTGLASSGFIDSGIRRIAPRHRRIFSLLNWWGIRGRYLDLHVELKSGKVSSFGYRLMVTTAHADYPYVVTVGVSFVQRVTEDSPMYRVDVARRFPSQSVGIVLSPQTPVEITKAAFDPNLSCLSSLGGCDTWREILPTFKPSSP
jgi:hypothetical protein